MASLRKRRTGYATLSPLLSTAKRDRSSRKLHPVVQRFQRFIESDPELLDGFRSMFAQIPLDERYALDPVGGMQIHDYKAMFERFNQIIQSAPAYNRTAFTACPFSAVINWPMATPAGLCMFLNPRVNEHFRAMFDVWFTFLTSPESRYVLTTDRGGWFGPEATEDTPDFAETFVCDPSAPYHGFKSWDDFFTRRLRPGIRPVEQPDDDDTITAACEHTVYRIAHDVAYTQLFWLKGEPYSLRDMLASDPLASEFVGGTVYQGFLNARAYHRWHTPVAGTVKKIVLVPGTYYAQSPAMGFGTLDGPDTWAPTGSQAYVTATAARALIFIQTKNTQIGLMCFMAVGLGEISSCAPSVSVGDELKKGDELGTFHHGGSTHCLLFRREAGVIYDEESCGIGMNVKLNVAIGRVGRLGKKP